MEELWKGTTSVVPKKALDEGGFSRRGLEVGILRNLQMKKQAHREHRVHRITAIPAAKANKS